MIRPRLRAASVGSSAVLCWLCVVACSNSNSNSDTSSKGPTSPSTSMPAVVTSSGCPAEADVVAAAFANEPHFTMSARRDIDGDRVDDEVVLAVDPQSAQDRCDMFIGVRTDDGSIYSAALESSSIPRSGRLPELFMLPHLGAPGAEIVVALPPHPGEGTLAQVYTLTGEGLRYMPVPRYPNGSFTVERRSETQEYGSSCTAAGELVTASATYIGHQKYRVIRRTYPVDGPAFGQPETTRHVVRVLALVDKFPEFGSAHFRACNGWLN